MVGIAELRERVQRIERPAAAQHGVLPFGVDAIDRVLPGGGLMRGALHEIVGASGDEEDGALAAAFAAGTVGRLAATTSGIVLWCLKQPDLYGPGLAAHGLDPGRLVLVGAACDAEILWAMEEGLRAGGVTAAVVGEIGVLPAVGSRRLQLAAERSGVTALILRRWHNATEAARERNRPNAAATRWRIAALPSAPAPTSTLPRLRLDIVKLRAGIAPAPSLALPRLRGRVGVGVRWGAWVGRARWRVELIRCRGGEPACWEVEIDNGKISDAAGSLSLAAALADRPASPLPGFAKIRRAG